MAYDIHIPDSEQEYLDGLPLSSQVKERVKRFIEESIGNVSEEFRRDPENRPAPDKPYFLVRGVFKDLWGDGRLFTIDFHIQDDKAAFGVLLIVFIECS